MNPEELKAKKAQAAKVLRDKRATEHANRLRQLAIRHSRILSSKPHPNRYYAAEGCTALDYAMKYLTNRKEPSGLRLFEKRLTELIGLKG